MEPPVSEPMEAMHIIRGNRRCGPAAGAPGSFQIPGIAGGAEI